MKTVLYLIDQPFDSRNYERLGIKKWAHYGWCVRVVDVTPLSHPAVWHDFEIRGGIIKRIDNYYAINNLSELIRLRRILFGTSYFINYAGNDIYCNLIKIVLVLNGSSGVVHDLCKIPSVPVGSQFSLFNKIKKSVKNSPYKIVKLVSSKIIFKILSILIKPKLGLASGTESIKSLRSRHIKEIIKAHNYDYDTYLGVKDIVIEPKTPYAVFIDEDWCFHSDFIYIGESPPCTPNAYFPVICKVLRCISKSLEVSVCVAAHPRSSYQKLNIDYYEGIPVLYTVTAELIRDCAVVVCHTSTAAQFAVLFNKPLIFITTNEIESYRFGYSSYFASEFGKQVINIDTDLDVVDWKKELYIDDSKYYKYIEKYIKTAESPQKSVWDIVIEHINR